MTGNALQLLYTVLSFAHSTRMDRTRIQTCNGIIIQMRETYGMIGEKWSSQVLEHTKKAGKIWHEFGKTVERKRSLETFDLCTCTKTETDATVTT